MDRLLADPAPSRASLFASHTTTSLTALVPIYGTYALDHKVFGSVRPTAVVVDWVLGGIAPAGLGLAALVGEGSLSPRARSIMAWSAIGLYAATRIGVLVVGNLHVTEYNRYLRLRLTAIETQGGTRPALQVGASW